MLLGGKLFGMKVLAIEYLVHNWIWREKKRWVVSQVITLFALDSVLGFLGMADEFHFFMLKPRILLRCALWSLLNELVHLLLRVAELSF